MIASIPHPPLCSVQRGRRAAQHHRGRCAVAFYGANAISLTEQPDAERVKARYVDGDGVRLPGYAGATSARRYRL